MIKLLCVMFLRGLFIEQVKDSIHLIESIQVYVHIWYIHLLDWMREPMQLNRWVCASDDES